MIDYVNFSPIPSLIGGLLIGIGVIIFFVSNGRLAGVSGIVNNALTKTHDRTINCLFLLGLVLGPIIYMFFYQITLIFDMTSSMPIIIFGGLMVGFGTKVSSGCTSGHGVCGISRFSIRSIVATILFILSAIMTVLIFQLTGLSWHFQLKVAALLMIQKILTLLSGVVFGLGLTISSMTNPAKVIGFLNIFGLWDPSLGFVMGGAILIAAPFFYFFENKNNLVLTSKINLPNKSNIDFSLVIGALLFGVGWGAVGFCPGPAVSSIALLNPFSLLFVVSMIVGFYISKFVEN